MNAIGLQPRHPAPSVTSQGTQTPIIQLQNAETQTERDLPEPSVSQTASTDGLHDGPSTSRSEGQGESSQTSRAQDGSQVDASAEANTSTANTGDSPEFGSGEDALARIRRLIAEGGMTAVVQREQSTTMASMGGFGNNIIVSHRIHRGSQTGTGSGRPPTDPSTTPCSSSGPLLLTLPQPQTQPYPHPQAQARPQATSPSENQLAPMWGPAVLSGPQPSGLSLAVDMDDVFDGGRTDDDSLPGPSSSLLLSSPSSSSSSSSHSPLPNSNNSHASPNGYPGDPYSR